MTTPSGTITLDNVQTEFGGTNPIGINEYYAGGTYVSAFVSGVPTSSTIDMNSLRNKTKISISNDKSSVNEGVYPLDPPKQDGFIDYNSLTEEQVFNWMFNAPPIKDRFKFPISKEDTEQLLLNRLKQKYEEQNQSQSTSVPWS